MKVLDLTGQKFNRLTVIKRVENKGKNPMWLCRCDCGNETIVRGSHLTNNKIKSCGCYNKEVASKRLSTHLKSKTKLYKIWQNMKKRCYNEYSTHYQNYGGRGIKVCNEWLDDFMNFYNWAMANGYKEPKKSHDITIDRINNNGNYEPSNCRWVDMKIQTNNRRHNHLITYKNETHTMSEWCDITGITKGALEYRLSAGWNIEKALTTPVRKW